jgi:hypothetical protein
VEAEDQVMTAAQFEALARWVRAEAGAMVSNFQDNLDARDQAKAAAHALLVTEDTHAHDAD